MTQDNVYKSVLEKLSGIPIEYLDKVDQFLTVLKKDINSKDKNRDDILKFAGSWRDMTDNDFEDYLKSIKDLKVNMFSRDIEF